VFGQFGQSGGLSSEKETRDVLGRARRMFRTRNGRPVARRAAVVFELLGEHFKPESTRAVGALLEVTARK
jgi:hypothetical protein